MKGRIIAAVSLAAAAAAGIVIFAVMKYLPVDDPVAEIRVNGEVVRRIPLSETAAFTIETDGGWNRIEVSNGRVSVTNADCPDRVCVQTGAISGGAVPIICLPHRLEVIVVNGSDEIDGVTG
ncbi:MAG: NusG domain II-containing protein [Oscillospiraceae bacterium]